MYITEAHASDTWPMKWSVEWPRPKTLEERISYAKTCARELKMLPAFTVAVDGMDNDFNTAFRSWPTCYYVVAPGTKRLLYIGDARDDDVDYASYDVRTLFAFLRSYKSEDSEKANEEVHEEDNEAEEEDEEADDATTEDQSSTLHSVKKHKTSS